MANTNTSMWLHNKLGTSNDSWSSGSICSQLNKEVLRNIKECFPDLQTQVKLKLLLSFFHIPRRLIEEWKTELEEIVEVAGLDSELWVSMIAETMKTFPSTSSLNTEISDYDDTRPIFTDMVNDLRKLVSKHSDLGMLPLECLYLNKNALISVVGQPLNPVKHFNIKRKPKSASLRVELLHKSADAQSSLKKASAPTIPLRSRGMPRKMTDTTPLKGIPSRMPTSGFRSAHLPMNQQRPNLSRTPAGRKDGGIKLIEFTEQPLGYAAAKKRKREQQLEEQAKKQEQKQAAAAAQAAAAGLASPTTTTPAPATSSPTQNATPTNTTSAETPSTPTTTNAINSFEVKTEVSPTHSGEDQVSSTTDVDMKDVKPELPKTEPITTDYAPNLTYTNTTKDLTASNQPNTETIAISSHSKTIKLELPAQQSNNSNSNLLQTQIINNSNTNVSLNNNNINMNHSPSPAKRPKQEIEIKSEEILVPANVTLEKHEVPLQQPIQTPKQVFKLLSTTQQLQQKQQQQQLQKQQTSTQTPPRLTQRVIIQQQPSQHVITQQPQPQQQQQTHVLLRTAAQQQKMGGITLTRQSLNSTNVAPPPIGTTINMDKLEIKSLPKPTTPSSTITLTQQQLRQQNNPLANLPNNISVKITAKKSATAAQTPQQQPMLLNNNSPVIITSSPSVVRQKQLTTNNPITTSAQNIKSVPLSQIKAAANSGPVIISQTIIQPAGGKRPNATNTTPQQQQTLPAQQQQQPQQTTQYIITSQGQQNSGIPSLSTFSTPTRSSLQQQQTSTLYQTTPQQGTTKILLKTSPSSSVVMTPIRQQQVNSGIGNPPPLVATHSGVQQQQNQQQQPTLLKMQNVQLPNRPVTIQPASQAAQQQHLQAQLQQQQQHPQHTIVSNTSATQQPKLTQVLINPSSGNVVSGLSSISGLGSINVTPNSAASQVKKIYVSKGPLLRSISGDVYQDISGLQGLGQGTMLMTTSAAGPPNLLKTTPSNVMQTQTIQLQAQPQQLNKTQQQLPTLITTNSLGQQQLIVQQQQGNIISSSPQQTIIRPVLSNQAGLTTLPQNITLVQRPGQQPQLVQMQQGGTGQSQLQRTIITNQPQQQQQQLRTQQIVLQQHNPNQQRIITTQTSAGGTTGLPQHIRIVPNQNNANISRTIVQIPQQQPQPQQQQTQQPQQRRGLSLSNEHVHKAHEMFRKANRVSRPDKALILGFMAGLRENPRPNSENVIVIKLGDSEERVPQDDGSSAMCLVEQMIRLDYNTGEWKTFQNCRRLDHNAQGQSNADGSVMHPQQNSVAIQ